MNGLVHKHRSYIRYGITIANLTHARTVEQNVLETYFMPFMREYLYRTDMKERFKRARRLLVFIQSRFMAQIQMKKSKLEVLRLWWDRAMSQLAGTATKPKEKTFLAQVMSAMNTGIVDEFLKRYLAQCKLRH